MWQYITLLCSFSYRVIHECNILSNDCLNSSSVNMFENKMDKNLRGTGCTYIKTITGLPISQWINCPLANCFFFNFNDNLVQFDLLCTVHQ